MASGLKLTSTHSHSCNRDKQSTTANRGSTSSLDTPESCIWKDESREKNCLQGIKDLYEKKLLFDVTLCVQGKNFGVHRAVLASSSDYFRVMFTTNYVEKEQKTIKINGIEAVAMEEILHYLYSGEAHLQTHTTQHILSAANLFQLNDLRDGCAEFMAKKLDIDNCIGIHFFAQAHECENLEFKAWELITEHFDSVAICIEFLELSIGNLLEIIKYDDLQATEEEVFEATLRWLMHEPEDRAKNVYEAFLLVRFALLDEYYFIDKVKSNEYLLAEPRLQLIFDEVIRYKLMKSRWIEIDLRFEPRYGVDFCR